MPTKKDRVGTERREEAKSAYQRKKGRHGRGEEESKCLRKKTELALREERKQKVPIKEKRVGTE